MSCAGKTHKRVFNLWGITGILGLAFLFGRFSEGLSCRADYWASDFYQAGNERNNIYALSIAADGSLYCGGDFFRFANKPGASGIAHWDGASWNTVGGGLAGGTVRVLLTVGSDLYVGGVFSQAGGLAVSNIAKWDGTRWNALGDGVSGKVTALAWKGGVLYAGGNFLSAGGQAVKNLAAWDGLQWRDVGGGVEGGTYPEYSGVKALHFVGDDLFVGGYFSSAGGIPASYVARWDGVSWFSLGDAVADDAPIGVPTGVLGLTSDPSGNLYACGWFDRTGPLKAEMVSRWDGKDWSELGEGLPRNSENFMASLYHDGKKLYAAGIITGIDGLPTWDGTKWTISPSPTSQGGPSLSVVGEGPALYLSATLSTPVAGGGYGIVRFDGQRWSTMGAAPLPYYKAGMNSDATVNCITTFKNQIIAAGSFGDGKIARWDGLNWNSVVQPVRMVTHQAYYALTSDADYVYVTGGVYLTDEQPFHWVARFNGTNWSGLGDGLPVGGLSLAVRGKDLFAGHLQGMSRWDGIDWSTDDGIRGRVSAIAFDRERVYAGGVVTNKNGDSLNHLAVYDGNNWSTLAGGVDGPVNALLVFDHRVYVGGDFAHAGDLAADHIAVWDGTVWSAVDTSTLGGPGTVQTVKALAAAPDGTVFAGGKFGTNGLARLTALSLTALPKGDGVSPDCVSGTVNALALRGADLFVGGDFRPDRPGDRENSSMRFAQWHISSSLLCPSVSTLKSATNGTALTYQFKVQNPGQNTALNCTLKAILPLGTSFLTADQGGHLTGQSVLWPLDELEGLGERTMTMTVRVESPGSLISMDEYSVGDLNGNLYRGPPFYTTVVRQQSPVFRMTGLTYDPGSGVMTLLLESSGADPSSDVHIQLSEDLVGWQELQLVRLTNGVGKSVNTNRLSQRVFYRALFDP